MIIRPEIDWNICQGCNPCEVRTICKVRAILQIDPGEPVYIDHTRCNNCGLCIPTCPHDAIVMQNTRERYSRS